MTGFVVTLDVGHGPGTAHPSGATHEGLVERELIQQYAEHAQVRLAERGVASRVVDYGPYIDRQTEWSSGVCDAYVSLHVNSGGGDYGLVLHRAADDGASRLARALLRGLMGISQLARGVRGAFLTSRPEGQVRGWETLAGKRVSTIAWGKPGPYRSGSERLRRNRGLVCIDGTPLETPTVLVEPGFIDSPAHREIWTESGLQRLGCAVADGVVDFLMEV